MRSPDPISRSHLTLVVGAVVRSVLDASQADVVVLLDDGSPEARLCNSLLAEILPAERLQVAGADDPDLEPVLRYGRANAPEGGHRVRLEAARYSARLRTDGLVTCAANKTALLLAPLPPDPLLPLGDVYATQVGSLAEGWSVPDEVAHLASLAGGMEALDEALFRRLDLRMPTGLDSLPEAARRAVEEALHRHRHSRKYPAVVPKIGSRTLGVDLHE